MLTKDEHKEMLGEMTDAEKETTTAIAVVRELNYLLSQPAFSVAGNLNELRQLVKKSTEFRVVNDNRDNLLEMLKRASADKLSLADFKTQLFHLSRLLEAQLRMTRLMKEVLGAPAVTELTSLMDNPLLKDLSEVLTG